MIRKSLNTVAEMLAYFRNPPFRKNTIFAANRNPHTGENALSIEIASYLKVASQEAKLTQGKKGLLAVWSKIAHETSSSSLTYGILMKNMGKNPGAADFCITFKGGHLWMEVKLPTQKSKLLPSQVFFKNWCEEDECNYCVVTSLQEAIDILKDYGILKL